MTLKQQCLVFGRLLYFFAVYTVTIKYVIPVSAAFKEGMPWFHYVYFWDVWWLFHAIVGYHLTRMRAGIWVWAMLLAVAEIIIIGVKFVLFLNDPVWDIWHQLWFWNKLLLILYFFGLFVWLLLRGTRKALEKRKDV